MSKPVKALAVLLGLTAAFSTAAPAEAQLKRKPRVTLPAPEKRFKAPEFPEKFKWLNTEQPLKLSGNLKGHVVVLDFWTYCCINCMHILPHLEYLEKKYAGKPVMIIGVHSAKFETEKKPENIQQAIERYRIKHPVIVDEDGALMFAYRHWGISGWPSFAVIDPNGKVVGSTGGEQVRTQLDLAIEALLKEGAENGTLAKKPLHIKPTYTIPGLDSLAYPGKITADEKGNRLIISDSNHDRIVITDPQGKVLQVVGSGKPGFKDGSLAEARFKNPQGVAVDGNILYVSDTDNHRLRKVDLDKKTVTTIAGDGKRFYASFENRWGGKKGTEQGIASPWDVEIDNGRLLIAMAGPHQLWTHTLSTGTTKAWVGSGREAVLDGPAREAALAQPSGLVIHKDWLYFTDTEGSAIRRASLQDGRVETLIGAEGRRDALFVFGYKDGDFSEAKLQHAVGIAKLDGKLIIADTYNDVIREMDLEKRKITTLYGGKGELDEPTGLAVFKNQIYIADTNHHRIVRLDPKTKKAEPLEIKIPVDTEK